MGGMHGVYVVPDEAMDGLGAEQMVPSGLAKRA